MSKKYEQLISEVSMVAAEIFNGREFQRIEPGEAIEIGQIVSGSERHLTGEDKTEGGTVDVIEQYILKNAGEGRFLARHCLELAWGNYEEDEIVTVDLDSLGLNDVNGYRYRGAEAITMAENVLKLLNVVKPAELDTVPETDLSGFDRHLADAAAKSEQLAMSRMSVAVADKLLGYVAMKQHLGEELSEEKYKNFVATMMLRHGLTEAEVDAAVDLRMQEFDRETQYQWGSGRYGE